MFTKVSHSGSPVKILSLGGCSSQNLVILAKSEPSGSLLDIENAAQAHSVTPRGFLGKMSSRVRSRHSKQLNWAF